jgi:hypothetical protein
MSVLLGIVCASAATGRHRAAKGTTKNGRSFFVVLLYDVLVSWRVDNQSRQSDHVTALSFAVRREVDSGTTMVKVKRFHFFIAILSFVAASDVLKNTVAGIGPERILLEVARPGNGDL